MLFENIVLESIAYALPDAIVTSDVIEERLSPLYERLKLPKGRLEWMTGIKERRFWPIEMQPSEMGALAAKKVFQKTNIHPSTIDMLIHTGVCRDRLEPATAAYVHHQLGLGQNTQVMDLSNACLGFLNAFVLAAGLIECGQIQTALIVSGENGRPLLEYTIDTLLSKNLDRQAIKPYFANLTIGAGAVAAIVTHKKNGKGLRLLGGKCLTDTSVNHLCQGQGTGNGFLDMQTDAEKLLEAGIALAKDTWSQFKLTLGWSEQTPDTIICHQVGKQHALALYKALDLDIHKDYSTYPFLGNMGSASVPISLALALEKDKIKKDHAIALLGIGSGLSSLMLGLKSV